MTARPKRNEHPDPVLPLLLEVLRDRKHVTFVLADDLDHCGMAELDEAIIVLDARNTDGQMRATICHELLHLQCDDCPEERIEAMTAELLVPMKEALSAIGMGDIPGVAARLGVDEQLVKARMRSFFLQGVKGAV